MPTLEYAETVFLLMRSTAEAQQPLANLAWDVLQKEHKAYINASLKTMPLLEVHSLLLALIAYANSRGVELNIKKELYGFVSKLVLQYINSPHEKNDLFSETKTLFYILYRNNKGLQGYSEKHIRSIEEKIQRKLENCLVAVSKKSDFSQITQSLEWLIDYNQQESKKDPDEVCEVLFSDFYQKNQGAIKQFYLFIANPSACQKNFPDYKEQEHVDLLHSTNKLLADFLGYTILNSTWIDTWAEFIREYLIDEDDMQYYSVETEISGRYGLAQQGLCEWLAILFSTSEDELEKRLKQCYCERMKENGRMFLNERWQKVFQVHYDSRDIMIEPVARRYKVFLTEVHHVFNAPIIPRLMLAVLAQEESHSPEIIGRLQSAPREREPIKKVHRTTSLGENSFIFYSTPDESNGAPKVEKEEHLKQEM